jgi:hypothetical protein
MAKPVIRPNPKLDDIFSELEQYLDFCREHGYRYDERDINNFKSYAWQQYSKFIQGKTVKNMWDEDLIRFESAR